MGLARREAVIFLEVVTTPVAEVGFDCTEALEVLRGSQVSLGAEDFQLGGQPEGKHLGGWTGTAARSSRFEELVSGFACITMVGPDAVTAFAPFGEVLFGDPAAVEVDGQEGLGGGLAVEPGDEAFALCAVAQALV